MFVVKKVAYLIKRTNEVEHVAESTPPSFSKHTHTDLKPGKTNDSVQLNSRVKYCYAQYVNKVYCPCLTGRTSEIITVLENIIAKSHFNI